MIDGKLSSDELEQFERFYCDLSNFVLEYDQFVNEITEKCMNDCENPSHDKCILKDGRHEICDLGDALDLMFYTEEKMRNVMNKQINKED